MTDPILAYYNRYEGEPVDITDARDRFSEEVRLALLNGVRPLLMQVHTDEQRADFISGALLGLVMAYRATIDAADPRLDRAIRNGLVQMIPWAIDSARLQGNLPPLEDVQ